MGSAALIGALVVGDSVRESLRERVLNQLGPFRAVLDGGDRFFKTELAIVLSGKATPGRSTSNTNDSAVTYPLLSANAIIARTDGSSRVNQINLIGCDALFAGLFLKHRPPELDELREIGEPWGVESSVILNQRLASKLGVSVGDEVILRVAKATDFSPEAAISPKNNAHSSVRLRVEGIAGEETLGDFSTRPGQSQALNAFMSLSKLGEISGARESANVLAAVARVELPSDLRRSLWNLVYRVRKLIPIPDWLYPELYRQIEIPPIRLTQRISESWRLDDLQVYLAHGYPDRYLELRSGRVFLEQRIVVSALAAATNAQPILTYLATLLRAGTNATPYSMVTAVGTPWTPADMREEEILVSEWLADDLHLKPGDEIAMSYFLPESGAKLTEATNTFRVRAIVPMEMPWADRSLMPDFPGIEKAESTSEWDAGFPLTYNPRPKDDAYWKQYRGTPKAFITLAAGQKMWGNRFGNVTAIRFPIPTNAATALTPALSPGERENRPHSQSDPKTADNSTASQKPGGDQQLSPLLGGAGQGEGERATQTNQFESPHVVFYKEALEKKILANLKPEELGLRFEPVREQALKAAAESQDFGGLFLGFSFFVIGAALLLMALLFSLGLEQRAPEVGTLLALGFTPKQVRSLLLREGVALAFLGGVIGALGGLAYAKAMLHGLTTIWRDAVGPSALSFHVTAQTLAIGLFASVMVSVVSIWVTLRKFVKRPARELLVGEIGTTETKVKSLKSKVIAVGALLAGVGLAGWAVVKGETANAGIFFGAGALVLVAGLGFASGWLLQLSGASVSDPARRVESPKRAESETHAPMTLTSLAVRGCARRRKRSLGTVAMLACGCFLIVSIGVFRLDANHDATKPSSGTGGFSLIGETTMPVVQDLNSKSGREFFALNEGALAGVNFVPFRVREGDEASCLNLNAAQRPRLLGVKPEHLAGRFTFAKGEGWPSLRSSRREEARFIKPEIRNPKSEMDPSLLTSAATEVIEVPAIGDANSIQWAMHKKVGDTIDYVDERGQPFKVRIVGAVANSILQGQLIIDEAEFVKRFPGASGYRMFLVDAPSNTVSQVSATLSRAMQDVGLELTPARQRLDQFNAVQNTYLGTFQVLGGLGLLLGSVGLGIVVLRNVLERRGELAVLLAVGFRKRTLQRLLLIENGTLLVVGLALGVLAAAVAVLPALFSATVPLPYASLALTLAAVLVNGAVWTWAATRLALRGDLLAALRNE